MKINGSFNFNLSFFAKTFSCARSNSRNLRKKYLLNKESYKQCLDDGITIDCKNKGFRFIDKTMKTYEQVKVGITPIYVKGVVMDDGIHIRPLDL